MKKQKLIKNKLVFDVKIVTKKKKKKCDNCYCKLQNICQFFSTIDLKVLIYTLQQFI
jgi:hypothetical protein